MTPVIVRRYLEHDGVRISYLTVDSSPPSDTLLLIHGAGVSARTWVHQLRGVAGIVRPIAIDLPGRRESDAIADPTLATYAEMTYGALRQLHAGPVFVAGHSLGGAVAQVLAGLHPEIVKGLVLISTCAKMPQLDGATRALAAVPWPFRRTVLSWAARRTLLAPAASSDAVRLTLDEICECRTSTLQSDVAIGRVIDVEDAARRLRVPTLILCGDRDELTPPPLSQRLGALIAGSRVEIVPSAGHMLPLEAPEAVNRVIVDFLGPLASEAARPAPAPSRRYALRFVVQRLVGRLWRSAPGT